MRITLATKRSGTWFLFTKHWQYGVGENGKDLQVHKEKECKAILSEYFYDRALSTKSYSEAQIITWIKMELLWFSCLSLDRGNAIALVRTEFLRPIYPSFLSPRPPSFH